MDVLREELERGAGELGVALDGRACERFGIFAEELVETNRMMNLTAITKPEEIALKHFVDSLAVLKYVSFGEGARLVDVGCGAGFPGVPVKIARPDLSLCCLDSLAKRVNFLAGLTEKLGLEIDCVHARAEEAGSKPPLRGSFDFAFARAVARLRVLAEYCLPFVKVGGAFVAMKGAASEEVAEAKNAVEKLGGEISDVFEYTLPGTDMARTIIVMRKIKDTPGKYPRGNAKIAKAPL